MFQNGEREENHIKNFWGDMFDNMSAIILTHNS